MSRRLFPLLPLLPLLPRADMPPPDWATARPDYVWSFPQDHWAHPAYATEWWYFTGHLAAAGESVPRYGYQFTFFRIGLVPGPPVVASPWAARAVIMGHAALTDLRTGRHVFSEVLYRAVPLLGGFGDFPDAELAWSRAPPGTDARWTLRWNGRAFDFAMRDARRELAFALSTAPARPRIFQGPNGWSRKGADSTSASLYYSYTRLATTGTVRLGDDSLAVEGTSWMDKEFGSNQLDADQVGWDWFSLQLGDGREVMLYRLRRADGTTDFARGTVVAGDGTPRYLTGADWTAEPQGTWTSAATGATYPARWRVRVPGAGLDVEVVPAAAAAENVSTLIPQLRYWEGPVRVVGGPGGRGYVELTGYGEESRVPAF